jgi:6-phosphogluconolactonase
VKCETSVWGDREALSRAAAGELAQVAERAIGARGRFDLALAGGSTPRRLYEILAAEYRERIDWRRTHLFWGDERYVPPGDSSSNYRMAREALIDPLGLATANVHPMPTDAADPEEAARTYEHTLRAHFGDAGPRFDLVLLGIGPEGHTASLFLGSPALGERRRWVMPVRVAAQPPLRLTLTRAALDAAEDVFFLVAGADKREIVAKLLRLPPGEDGGYPAAQLRPRGRVVIFLDRTAYGGNGS